MGKVLNLYCVYNSPTDFPGEYVARRFQTGPEGSAPKEIVARASSLEELRRALPQGLTLLPRQPDDDPVIVESWLGLSETESDDPRSAVRQQLFSWMEARDLSQARYFIERHPELMSETAIAVLEEEMRLAEHRGDETRLQSFSAYYHLLRRSLELGIRYAFDELAAAQRRPTPAELRELVLEAGDARRRMQKEPSLQAADAAVNAWYQVLNAHAIEKHAEFREAIRLELASALDNRAELTGNVDDIRAAISENETVLAAAAAGPDLRIAAQYNLANSSLRLYQVTSQLDFLERAITLYQEVLQDGPRRGEEWTRSSINLIRALLNRHDALRQVSDLDRALSVARSCLEAVPEGSVSWIDVQNSLVTVLLSRYEALQEGGDLEKAFVALEGGLHFAAVGTVEWIRLCDNLSQALRQRYALRGSFEDLEAAVKRLQMVVKTLQDSSPDFARMQDRLGTALRDRYRARGILADLESAVVCHRDAVRRTGHDKPQVKQLERDLARTLQLRFDALKQQADLDETIAILQSVGNGKESGSIDSVNAKLDLGHALRTRFDAVGQMNDLDEAFRIYQGVLAAVGEGSPAYRGAQFLMGEAFRSRYEALGQVADLEAAIACLRRALTTQKEGSSDWAKYHANLGNLLRIRYQALEKEADLSAAITSYTNALSATERESPDWRNRQGNLGLVLLARYQATKQMSDLDAGIVALKAWDDGEVCADWATTQANLAGSLFLRYEATNQVADREAAFAVYSKALEHIRRESKQWALMRFNQGRVLLARFDASGLADDRDAALIAFREALGLLDVEHAPGDYLHCAHHVGQVLVDLKQWNEAAELLKRGVRAISLLYSSQALDVGKDAWLRRAFDIYRLAAYSLARGGHSEDAVVALEQGRAKRLNDLLMQEHADLHQVQAEDPEGYARFVTAAARVKRATSAQKNEGTLSQAEEDAQRQEASSAHQDLEAAVRRIRCLPRFERFLLEPSFDDVISAVSFGRPLVYLVTCSAGSVALIVYRTGSKEPVRVEPVWADDFTSDVLNSILLGDDDNNLQGSLLHSQLLDTAALQVSLDRCLPLLGEQLIRPVAARLRKLRRDHVNLIPCGLLGLLPLTAVEYSNDGKRCVFLEEFALTYVPSARVLSAISSKLAAFEHRTPVLVGVGNPLPNPRPLPFARAELEEVMTLFPAMSSFGLWEEEATEKALYQALPNATHVHFACHGMFNMVEPMDSCLQLANQETLTLRKISDEERFQAARLVVLSACQTAVTQFDRLVDEVIGMPAGFLRSGVPGIIATLWPVSDLCTALLMIKFYGYHLQGDKETKRGPMAPAEALRAAQRWLRNVTNAELSAVFDVKRRTAPDRPRMAYQVAREQFRRYTLNQPTARPFSDSYFWAPFVLTGI